MHCCSCKCTTDESEHRGIIVCPIVTEPTYSLFQPLTSPRDWSQHLVAPCSFLRCLRTASDFDREHGLGQERARSARWHGSQHANRCLKLDNGRRSHVAAPHPSIAENVLSGRFNTLIVIHGDFPWKTHPLECYMNISSPWKVVEYHIVSSRRLSMGDTST